MKLAIVTESQGNMNKLNKSGSQGRVKTWIPEEIIIRSLTDLPGTATLRHRHNYIQTGLLFSGTYQIELDNKHRLTVGKGEFFSIARRQEHVITVLGNDEVKCVDLRFKACLVGETDDRRWFEGGSLLEVMTTHTFKIRNKFAVRLRPILQAMLSQASIVDSGYSLIVCFQMMKAAALMRKMPRQVCKVIRYQTAEHQSVIKVLEVIHKRYADPLSLTDLAEASGVSASHLSRLFHQFTSASPKRYLLNCRIEAAKRLLLSDDESSMKDIAARCGFADQHQFSRAFHRLTGCAPSNYLVKECQSRTPSRTTNTHS